MNSTFSLSNRFTGENLPLLSLSQGESLLLLKLTEPKFSGQHYNPSELLLFFNGAKQLRWFLEEVTSQLEQLENSYPLVTEEQEHKLPLEEKD